ncbi:DUF5302 domain-containing protein [Actinopolymorpha singaporensis]|uniref:DUF5302 domain-containing protein n=1 Tax=Actinopolymorpha singaporensis TaxID=117157 RepID=A0A1H1QHA8_9ACTN|nr:DUF5302 domain-containing protein [Actinopolymorpha singaporensis]SDS22786.1 hypothetical protein SAMN04489717_2015 [Actinopolymorpha singaporensis]
MASKQRGKPESASTPAPDAAEVPDTQDGAEAPEATNGDSEDDVRRKFRESLERKRHQHRDQLAEGTGKASQKIQEGLAPTTGRRSFRRKSG